MDIMEKYIRYIIDTWELGEKFIMTKSWRAKNGKRTDKYVGKQFILIEKDTDYVVFASDFATEGCPKPEFVCVPYPIAVTAFEQVAKKKHNSEYFADDNFFNKALTEADIEVQTIFRKTTIVAVRFANGFVMVESSSCVKEQDYNKELGIKLCMKKIEQKYMEHIAFEFCDDVYGWSSIKQKYEWD